MIRGITSSLFHIFLLILMGLTACVHAPTKPIVAQVPQGESVALIKKNVKIVFVPENLRIPPHLLFQKEDRYAFSQAQQTIPFKIELGINPLMRNPILIGKVLKKNKVLREFVAKKTATSHLSDRKNAWMPTRSKLLLTIPYINAGEEVVVSTSYEWMDVRWLAPILMQENGLIADSSLTVDVPYGVTMHFKAAKDFTSLDFLPSSHPHEMSLWVQEDNRAGLGMRYIWQATEALQSVGKTPAEVTQVLLSFDTASPNDGQTRFDNWGSVSSYLYERIDRFDWPSDEIRKFARKETEGLESKLAKITRIFSFLRDSIEKRSVAGSYQEQEVQPATRTFARKFGTAFDVAILGKAMLSSIGIEADLVAVADKRFNPKIDDFFSPALFNSVILAVSSDGQTLYFDAEQTASSSMEQVRPSMQGQHALTLQPKNSKYFTMPFDSAQKNTKTQSYQLWMSENGLLEGEYSIDLTGQWANSISKETLDPSVPKNVSQIEKQIVGSESAFSFETLEIASEYTDSVRAFGQIKPRLLPKNNSHQFNLTLAKIIEPVVNAIKEAPSKDFSSITNISLFVNLPERFVLDSLPNNVNLQFDGIDGRFSASYNNGQLIVEGIAIISLPIKKDLKEIIDREMNTLKLFGEHNLAIEDTAKVTGDPDDGQKPTDSKDS